MPLYEFTWKETVTLRAIVEAETPQEAESKLWASDAGLVVERVVDDGSIRIHKGIATTLPNVIYTYERVK